MSQSPLHADPMTRDARRFIRIAAYVSAAIALMLAGYLTFESLTGDGLPPGCGGEGGCGAVLTSKYAYVLGMPVGALALVSYLLLLIALCKSSAKWARRLIICISVCILASAAWFVYLQLGVLHAICVYCMTDHTAGVLAVICAMFALPRAGAGRDAIGVTAFVIAGLLAAAALMIVQSHSTTPIVTVGPPQGNVSGAGGDRTLNLLGGQYVLTVADEPHIGPLDAPHTAVILLDYACPHCRATHLLLQKLQAEFGDDMLLVIEPASTWPTCNPHIAYDHPKFAESCELAELAWAVYLADPSKFAAYDHWLYDWPDGQWQPRKAVDARTKAEQLVGAEALQQAIDSGEPRRLRQRNIEALESAGSDRVPVTIIPGHPPMIGVIDDAAALRKYLQPSGAYSP